MFKKSTSLARLAGSFVVAAYVFGCAAVSQADDASWHELKNCRLLANEENDGDSFHVMYEGKEFVFRLYFVDTPETSLRFEDRIREQAEYFSISESEVLPLGRNATRYTTTQLRQGFTVWTRWAPAKGSSATPSHYALVKVDQKDLGQKLVRHGLARLHGAWVDLPDGTSSEQVYSHLQQLEYAAQTERLGGWGSTTAKGPTPHAIATGSKQLPAFITCHDTINAFAPEYPYGVIGYFARDAKLEVIATYPNEWVLVRFHPDNGDEVIALCRKSDLS